MDSEGNIRDLDDGSNISGEKVASSHATAQFRKNARRGRNLNAALGQNEDHDDSRNNMT